MRFVGMGHDPRLPHATNETIDFIAEEERKIAAAGRTRMRLVIAQKKETLSCTDCTAASCCSQSIIEPLGTLLPLARYLRATGKDTPELREKLRVTGAAMEGTSRVEWFKQDQACLFLTPERRCSIYEHRPMACRNYYVVSPSELCSPTIPDASTRVIAMTPLAISHMALAREIHSSMHLPETDRRLLVGAFPRVLGVLLEMMDMPDESLADFVRLQHWPSLTNLTGWINEGKNPFHKEVPHVPG